MYVFWSFRCFRDWFRSFIKIFFIAGFSSVFVRFFLHFLGVYKKFVIYFHKLLLFIRLFQFFSTHWRFVLILWEFSVNFKDFYEFFEILWIFLDFMGHSWLVLDYYISFLVFSVLRDWFRSFIKIFFIICFS